MARHFWPKFPQGAHTVCQWHEKRWILESTFIIFELFKFLILYNWKALLKNNYVSFSSVLFFSITHSEIYHRVHSVIDIAPTMLICWFFFNLTYINLWGGYLQHFLIPFSKNISVTPENLSLSLRKKFHLKYKIKSWNWFLGIFVCRISIIWDNVDQAHLE